MIESSTQYVCPIYDMDSVLESPDLEPSKSGEFLGMEVNANLSMRRKNNPLAILATAGRNMSSFTETDHWEVDVNETQDAMATFDLSALLIKKVLKSTISRQLADNCSKCVFRTRCVYVSDMRDQVTKLTRDMPL